jgi:hypothetical protein
MIATTLLPFPQNQRQWSFIHCWPGIIENARAVRGHKPMSEQLTAFLQVNASNHIATVC